jgi:hypothetical protein
MIAALWMCGWGGDGAVVEEMCIGDMVGKRRCSMQTRHHMSNVMGGFSTAARAGMMRMRILVGR